ncbi:response regulator [Polyangium sp. 15x6]|uniref:response regulator n=1 Tax=Polyangium sp. 15x6 TaxID=3042687 RepID=UPI00249AB866|nr:response regulator [Polyangium sp. 15x6]MDI3289857.1 response regulator [Polyangium sp. 15x6]
MAKLLIVDDDDETRLWMATALADVGHEVRMSPSGRDAVKVVSTWRPDLAIVDVLMSEMDGFAVNRVLRSHGIPTMFVTVVKREAEAILQGVSGYVEKPVTAGELRAVVERVLGGATGGAILLVEDDSFLRSVYRSVLEPKFQVLEAENGRDALSLLATHPVALVITDIHMPVMNGVELVRAIRSDARMRDLPVVVQSCDTSAVRSPIWSGLHVSRVMRKEDFIGWLIAQIEEQLSTLSVRSA